MPAPVRQDGRPRPVHRARVPGLHRAHPPAHPDVHPGARRRLERRGRHARQEVRPDRRVRGRRAGALCDAGRCHQRRQRLERAAPALLRRLVHPADAEDVSSSLGAGEGGHPWWPLRRTRAVGHAGRGPRPVRRAGARQGPVAVLALGATDLARDGADPLDVHPVPPPQPGGALASTPRGRRRHRIGDVALRARHHRVHGTPGDAVHGGVRSLRHHDRPDRLVARGFGRAGVLHGDRCRVRLLAGTVPPHGQDETAAARSRHRAPARRADPRRSGVDQGRRRDAGAGAGELDGDGRGRVGGDRPATRHPSSTAASSPTSRSPCSSAS